MRLYGVGARLSLALAAVVTGALVVVYLVVVPSLENRVVHARVQQLADAAPLLAQALPADPYAWPDFVQLAAARTNARIAVLGVLRREPPALAVVQDSHGATASVLRDDPVAQRAVQLLEPARGTVVRGRERFAEAAAPLAATGPVILLSAPLRDALADVRLVERRLLLAGAIALGFAALVGYAGSIVFARRVRRLERAVDRIAGGEFATPVGDRGNDELGDLAAAVDRMRERLAQLDRARGEFIANASHELRTPVFSLSGFLELLDDEELDESTRRDFLATMRAQVDRLTKLATELLDLSRLDAGRLRVERETFDLAAVARAAAAEFAGVAARQGRPLAVEAPMPVGALGDEQRALQIARALVDNALAHSPPDVEVRVRATGIGPRALLVVEDAGPGVAPEHAEHVFERFYRVGGAVASGSGLGLAIARELAQLMGGALELDSAPGRTTFTLSLPAVAAAVPLHA